MSTVISIQARLGSTRLPGKVLLHLADRRILEWVVERAVSATTENIDVVVALGDGPENKALEELCRRDRYQYVVGPEDDLLQRHLKVARTGEYDTLVRLTADCPFVPAEEIMRTLAAHEVSDAAYTRNDWPADAAQSMPVGTAVDVFDVELIERLKAEGATHPNRRPLDAPDEYGVAFVPNDDWVQYADVHLAVDTPVDYWSLADAVNAAGDDPCAVADWLA